MAQRMQTLFIDDIDGSEADGTVRFRLDGTEYEIDLSAKHAGHCGTHSPAVSRQHARPREYAARSHHTRRIGRARQSTTEVREWAQDPRHRRQRTRPDTS